MSLNTAVNPTRYASGKTAQLSEEMIRLLEGSHQYASDDLRNSVVLRREDGVHELPQFAIATDKQGPSRELSTVR